MPSLQRAALTLQAPRPWLKQGWHLRLLALLLTGIYLLPAQAQRPLPTVPEPEARLPAIALSTLTERASLVALVQVLDVDYEYTRDFPTGGTAFLKPLIVYKTAAAVPGIIDVYEEGLHVHECYFPNPSVIEEGQRFLVFLRPNPQVSGQWLGMPEGCRLSVLVTDQNRYALRYPLKGIDILPSAELDSAAEPLTFADAHAVLSLDDLTVAERDELLAGGYLQALDDGNFRLTHGIDLTRFRQLLGEQLTTERSLRRTPIE